MFGPRFVRIGCTLLFVFLLAVPSSAEDCELIVSTAALSSPANDGSFTQMPNGRIARFQTRASYRYRDDGGCSPIHKDPQEDGERPYRRHRYALDLFRDGFGIKAALGPGTPGWQFALTQTGTDTGNLALRLGIIYRIPEPFFVWHFYGGGGMSYTLPGGGHHPYYLTGTEFFFMFWEHGYIFDQPDWRFQRFHRMGFRFRF